MSKYLFDSSSILQVIGNELIQNPVLIGSVLKHKDQKTFKYIVRNILPLRYLQLVGNDRQVVFQEADDQLDLPIAQFFKRMLLDTHTISKQNKVFRQEARKIFVKEVTKNLLEHELIRASGDALTQFNSKLLQNYGALLLIAQFLMVPDKKNDKLFPDQRVRALYQSIRRYNQEQKNKMVNQILYETQVASHKAIHSSSYGGIKVSFFAHVHRIRDELQKSEANPIVLYKPKALSQCIEVLIQVLNQFAKNQEMWNQLIRREKIREVDRQEGKSSAEKQKKEGTKILKQTKSKAKHDLGENNSEMDNLMASDSDEELEKGGFTEAAEDGTEPERQAAEAQEEDESAEDSLDELSDIDDDSYGEEDNEEDMLGELSEQEEYYNEDEDEEMEDEYYDEELDGEEGEQELISIGEGDEDLLVNSPDGSQQLEDHEIGEDSSIDDINPDDLEEGASDEDESYGDEMRSRSYGDELGFEEEDVGFDEDGGNSQFRDGMFSDDDFSSSMNSLYNQDHRERIDRAPGGEIQFGLQPRLNRIPNQYDGNSREFHEIEQQLAQYGLRRVEWPEGREPHSRSASPPSSRSLSVNNGNGFPAPPRHLNIPEGFMNRHEARMRSLGQLPPTAADLAQKKESEDDFWKRHEKDLAESNTNIFSELSIQQKFTVYNRLFSRIIDMMTLIKKHIRTDDNLFMSNIPMISRQGQAVSEVQAQPLSIQLNGAEGQSSLVEEKAAKDSEAWKHEMIDFSNVQGYKEFEKAIKIISGEEVSPSKEEKPKEEDQIDSKQLASKNTLDMIDPVFAQALNEQSIQGIKDNDKLIKQIQIQSSLASKAQIQTINDFLKKQSTEVRQSLLKNLDTHILSHLTSDLYTEARRLRAPPAQQAQQVGANQGQQPGGVQRPARLNALQRRAAPLPSNQRGSNNQVPPLPVVRGHGIAATDANLQPEGLPALAMQSRNRFMSMESQTIAMEEKLPCDDDVMKKGHRDSESEDLNIPQQKSNFHQNAFFFNIHTFMKENMLNLHKSVVRDLLTAQTTTGHLSRRKESLRNQIFTHEDLEQYCENLIIEQFKETPPEQDEQVGASLEASNIHKIIGILDIAMTEIICSKASTQLRHISPEKQLAKFKIITQIPNFRLGLIVKIVAMMNAEMQGLVEHINIGEKNRKAMAVYKGCTQIWDLPQADSPVLLSPKACIAYFVKYVYELQQMLREAKGNLIGILDLLKSPKTDRHLSLLYQELKMTSLANSRSDEKHDIMDMSILDVVLHMIITYIDLLYRYPEAFEFEESQQKEFNRWKQEVLQNLSLILQQVNDALTFIIRKKPSETEQQKFTFSSATLDALFKILFFLDHDDQVKGLSQKHLVQQQSLFMDQSPKTIKQVSKLLSRFSLLPIREGQGQNILNFDPKDLKKPNPVVQQSLSTLLNQHLTQFTEFFGTEFQGIDSLLVLQRKELTLIIQKVQHILKVFLSLTQSQVDQQPNICQEHFLLRVLEIVQHIVETEEDLDSKKGETSIDSKTNYLYREEFKLIMQLIFSLSEYDLKYELLESKQEQLQTQEAGGRRSSKKKGSKNEPQVVIQSIDDLKRMYDPNLQGRDSSLISSSIGAPVVLEDEQGKMLQDVLRKYKPGRVQELIRFFFRNKKLINRFICLNQTAINEQFQDLVIQVPQILDFDSKRLIWKICVKKYIKKNFKDLGEFEIDLQVRRNQVFGDSFEQLKHIQLDSWKQKFSIEFHDEEGVDEGGLTKEWYELLSRGIFDPNYALFLQSAKGSTYYPNPSSIIHEKEEMVQYFRFVGRFIGKAIIEGQLLDCYFVKALYKMMLGDALVLKDLEDYDEQVYKSLLFMLENDAEMLCQSFVFSSKLFDEEKDIELKPSGKDIDVTNDNKFEYCQLVLNYRLYQSIKVQVDAFLQGFHDLVPSNLIKLFDYKELELLISGLPTIDIEDLKENTIYKNYNKQSPIIVWLWEVLEELNNSERAEFIQFVTGSSKVPVEGFKALRCSNGVQKFQVIKYQTDRPDKRLPQAHTCFFQLDLPEYSSKEILKERLLVSIKEGKTFGIA